MLGLAAIVGLAACSPAKAPDADTASSQAPDLSFYLQPAFKAAFGTDAPAPHAIDRPGGKAVRVQGLAVRDRCSDSACGGCAR